MAVAEATWRGLARVGRLFGRVLRAAAQFVLRLHLLFAARHWILLAFAVVASVFSVQRIAQYAVLHDPPRVQLDRSIGFGMVSPFGQTNHIFRYYIDVQIGLDGCRNPVRVVADVGFPPEVNGALYELWGVRRLAISFTVGGTETHDYRLYVGYLEPPDISTMSNFDRLFDDEFMGYGSYPKLNENGYGAFLVPLARGSGQPHDQFEDYRRIGYAFEPEGWMRRSPPPFFGFVVTFLADWVRPRSIQTCYVLMPDIRVEAGSFSGVGLSDLFNIETNADVAPTAVTRGSIKLRSWNGLSEASGAVLRGESSAPPATPYEMTWRCAGKVTYLDEVTQGSSCAGYAVIAEPGAATSTTAGLILYSTILGVALALGVQALMTFRWPLSRRAPDSGM